MFSRFEPERDAKWEHVETEVHWVAAQHHDGDITALEAEGQLEQLISQEYWDNDDKAEDVWKLYDAILAGWKNEEQKQ